MHRSYAPVVVLCFVLALSACGRPVSSTFSEINSGLSEGASPAGAAAPTSAAAPPAAADYAVGAEAAAATIAPAAAESRASRPQGEVAPMKAGIVDDNQQFADYLDYLADYKDLPVRSADVRERFIITVRDGRQFPVLDAQVTIYDGQDTVFNARTYAGGKTIFHPRLLNRSSNAQSWRVVVRDGNASAEATLAAEGPERIEIVLDGAEQPADLKLDLLFMLDTTGSMADELNRIQQTIDSIAQRIDAFTPRPQIRYGLVAFRDYGDEYVTRTSDFVADLGRFRRELNELYADGGGDTPEAVEEALYDGITRMSWNDDAVRLVFLVGDAAPHISQQSQYTYLDATTNALGRGVKIYPIAASNTDPQAEYVFRQLAQQTLASFVFLTYQEGANGGVPGESTVLEAGAQSYSVDRLDDLIVTIVERELAAAVGAQ
jgi:hypothetical protein